MHGMKVVCEVTWESESLVVMCLSFKEEKKKIVYIYNLLKTKKRKRKERKKQAIQK